MGHLRKGSVRQWDKPLLLFERLRKDDVVVLEVAAALAVAEEVGLVVAEDLWDEATEVEGHRVVLDEAAAWVGHRLVGLHLLTVANSASVVEIKSKVLVKS